MNEEKLAADKVRYELENKTSALETLQTVVDVLKAEETEGNQARVYKVPYAPPLGEVIRSVGEEKQGVEGEGNVMA